MAVSTWTDADSERTRQIWADYQRQHDVSARIGQTAGIDPADGRIWFGESAADISRQRQAEGVDQPFYCAARWVRLLCSQGGPPVITGTVGLEDVPVVSLPIAGRSWSAVIDTGFNGDLELPVSIQPFVNAQFLCRSRSLLAGGQVIDEDTYLVDFLFDGRLVCVEATFVAGEEILIGTRMLRHYRLEIDFVARTLRLERVN